MVPPGLCQQHFWSVFATNMKGPLEPCYLSSCNVSLPPVSAGGRTRLMADIRRSRHTSDWTFARDVLDRPLIYGGFDRIVHEVFDKDGPSMD